MVKDEISLSESSSNRFKNSQSIVDPFTTEFPITELIVPSFYLKLTSELPASWFVVLFQLKLLSFLA